MSATLLNTGDHPNAADAILSTDPQAFMSVIQRAATDPSVDVSKMEKLWEMYKSIVQWQAEKSFNAAFAQMQAKMPVITERGEIKNGQGKVVSQYAYYEDINDTVKPLLQEYGFAMMFKTDDTDPQRVRVVGILMHEDGHRESCPLPLPADTSGFKNEVQSYGSSISYAKRYILIDLLNITTRGQDDDGQTAGVKTITESQAADLQALIEETKTDKNSFLTYISGIAKRQITSLQSIPENLHKTAVDALNKKRNQTAKTEKGGK